MAHPDELARELVKTPVALAQRHDAKIVNDNPGYMASHGDTVDEQGRTTYRNPNYTGPPILLVQTHSSGTATAVNGGTDLSSVTLIPYNTDDYDPAGLFASNVFTCPSTGTYMFIPECGITRNGNNWSVPSQFAFWYQVNGITQTSGTFAYYMLPCNVTDTGFYVPLQGVGVRACNSGDTVGILVYNNDADGYARTIASGATLAIFKVG